jgi:hypothetical protein
MGDVRISGRILAVEPDLVFLTVEGAPSQQYVLWTAGNLATPNRLDSTSISSASSSDDYLADTELSPDGLQALYCRVRRGLTPNQSLIRKVAFDDSTNVLLYTDIGDHDAFGNTNPLQPTWSPDGNEILFRAKGVGNTLNVLKVMAPDGTGVTTIYTEGAGDTVGTPYYNYDGTKIAWTELIQNVGFARLRVANADGTGATTVYSETSPASIGFFAWAQDSNVLAFTRRASSAFSTTDWSWRKINSDGTGLTVLFAIDRSVGYGASDIDPSAIKWSWLPDDSGIATTIQDNPAVDDHFLTKIFADGSGKTNYSPTRITPSGTPDFRPVVFKNGARIYFADANPATQLSSILLDGSDYRQDFTGTGIGPSGSDVTFHGFKGDTLNI